MIIQATLAATAFTAAANAYINSQGIHLEVDADFRRYADHVGSARPERPIATPFCAKRHFLSQDDGFCVLGRDKEGQVVHTQAMRKIVLSEQSLSDFLSEQFHQFPLAEPEPDFSSATYVSGPGARQITGVTFYHGDFWLDDTYRKTALSAVLSRFAQALCLLHWKPDYVFGFMPNPIAFKGLAEREGYMHSDPFSLRWSLSGQERAVECFLVWQSRHDIEHIIQGPVTGH